MIEGDWHVLIYFDQRGSIKPSRRHQCKMDGGRKYRKKRMDRGTSDGGGELWIDSYDQLSRWTMMYDSHISFSWLAREIPFREDLQRIIFLDSKLY